jgi:hypothetical protein
MWPADEGCDVNTPDSIHLQMLSRRSAAKLNSHCSGRVGSAVGWSVRRVSAAAERRVASVVETAIDIQ